MSSSDVHASNWPIAAVPAAYLTPGPGSFTEFLARAEPHLLPGNRMQALADQAPHGTTIVALTCADGVVLAGDRRATMGNLIAQRDIEKVFVADSHSAIGIAGTAGIAVEMVRLFQLELEHYEKIEGVRLSLDGKANRLATMIRGNLGAAMQGLAVVPLFAGFDIDRLRAAEAGPDLLLRHRRRPVRGARLLLGRLRLDVRPVGPEEAVTNAAPGCPPQSRRRSRRSTTPPTTTLRPAAPT